MIECCANCRNCVGIPKNNRYGDVEYICLVDGYYLTGIQKDRTKVERYSPGGKKLECRYKPNRRNDTLGFPQKDS